MTKTSGIESYIWEEVNTQMDNIDNVFDRALKTEIEEKKYK